MAEYNCFTVYCSDIVIMSISCKTVAVFESYLLTVSFGFTNVRGLNVHQLIYKTW